MANPYEAPKTPVSDPEPRPVRRPRAVTIALVILWAMQAIWVLGVFRQIMRLGLADAAMSAAYLAFLSGMTIVPAFLLVMIGRATHWARVMLIVLDGLVFLSRIYLLSTLATAPAMLLKSTMTPAALQIVAFTLLFLPKSNAWFRHRQQ